MRNRRVQLGLIRYESPHMTMLIDNALALIDQALHRSPRAYVAFSTGKDSIATLALVHKVNDTIPVCWGDDELEFPETIEMIRGIY